jgi:(p)ppGpp synthase/HD superfamily hydrolase
MNARELAEKLHGDQIRKSNGLSYVTHLEETANTVANYGGSKLAIDAAWLHDSIEDQKVDESLIDSKVLTVVKELTEDKSLEWENRKQQAIEHILVMSHEAAMVKAGDVMSNLRGLFRDGYGNPEVWKCFKRSREQTLEFYSACVENLKKRTDLPEAMRMELRLILSYTKTV